MSPRAYYTRTEGPERPDQGVLRPFELQGVQEKDLIDFTPELKAEAVKVASRFKLGPLFTPPIVRGDGGKTGMVYVPNGANWPGGSFDPETGILYVYSNTLTRLISLANDSKRSDMDYINSAGGDDTGGGLTAGLEAVELSLVKKAHPGSVTASAATALLPSGPNWAAARGSS